MDAKDAYRMAQQELAIWPQLAGWKIRVSCRMSRTLGLCRYRTRTIQLSLAHLQLNDAEKVRETVLHELAHALVGPGHGHDKVWRTMARRIGANPARCDHDANMPPGNWIAVCHSCGLQFNRYRRPKAGRLRWCLACGPDDGLLTFIPNGERL